MWRRGGASRGVRVDELVLVRVYDDDVGVAAVDPPALSKKRGTRKNCMGQVPEKAEISLIYFSDKVSITLLSWLEHAGMV